MAAKKPQKEVVAFFTTQFEECIEWWADEPSRQAAGVSLEYAAYHGLACAALLERGDENGAMAQLKQAIAEHEAEFLCAACRFAQDFSAPPELIAIWERETALPEDLEMLELTLSHRDELDLVIESCKRMLPTAQAGQVLPALATAIGVASELDDLLLSRPELMAVGSRSLVDIRPIDWLAEGSYPDWFAIARQWDAASSSELAAWAAPASDAPTPGTHQGPAAWQFMEDEELATAAVDSASPRSLDSTPGPAIYLALHCDDLCRGEQVEVWLDVDEQGGVRRHVIGTPAADQIARLSGPFSLPPLPPREDWDRSDAIQFCDWILTTFNAGEKEASIRAALGLTSDD